MRLRSRFLALLTVGSILFASALPLAQGAQQPPQTPAQMLEPLVKRLKDELNLTEEQVASLRHVLTGHEAKFMELRRRAQVNPFAPALEADQNGEQKAIKDEIGAFLTDEQKPKLAAIDARLPIPPAPGFYLINLPPRADANDAAAIAAAERSIAPVAVAAKGKNARLTDDQKILQLLNRLTFGPRPGDVERVRQIGLAKFLDEQLNPASIDNSELDRRLAVLPTVGLASTELYQFYPPPNVATDRSKEKNPQPIFGRPGQVYGELVQQKLVRAVASNRQLQEVMTDFWFNHLNVFAFKDADQWFLTSYERDVIRPRALGKFRDLLLATAESPAMMFYLDNWLSFAPDAKEPRPTLPPPPAAPKPAAPATKPAGQPAGPPTAAPAKPLEQAKAAEQAKVPEAARPAEPPRPAPPKPGPPKRGINENYARELMELHTMGVDGGYTQKDVQEVARCFTGWTIDKPYQGGSFVFRPWMHDQGAKIVLGTTIPAGGGIEDGIRVIEILSRHPSTARFVSKKLCQRFVSDDPPPQLVERVAQVFLRTDGDIPEVLRAIFTSPEFNSPAAFRAKVKSPLELVASAIRAVDGDTNGAPALHEWIRKMGEPLYQYAFPTGYGERSAIWVNTGVFFNRINFAVALANNQVPGSAYKPTRLISPETAANPDEATNRLAALIIHTELSPESRRLVQGGILETANKPQPIRAVAQPGAPVALQPAMLAGKPEPLSEQNAARRIQGIVGLLFGSAEFQRR